MKYCKECKFSNRNWHQAFYSFGLGQNQWVFARCGHIKAINKADRSDAMMARGIKFSPDTQMYCSTMRDLDHLCGEDAKYYEEKE